MNVIIRKAELRDAANIVKAEQEIAQEPGFFCSQPSELSARKDSAGYPEIRTFRGAFRSSRRRD